MDWVKMANIIFQQNLHHQIPMLEKRFPSLDYKQVVSTPNLRCYHNCSCNDVSIFQCDSRSSRLSFLLAINSLLSDKHVHSAGQDQERKLPLVWSPSLRVRVLDCNCRLWNWFSCRYGRVS